ncbi:MULTISPECIES: histidine phosphatase family protein [unclassified Bradyrhizobium]|uniref:histidine phosphatase family protein n=1 Tax=unclassified Bradyrhizobium TaxID=2631580 RepID=UPI001FFACCD5|nr:MULTISPECIES: histidine phosphatase family protein [unclassified Bradyrhizobium]MCK1709291.1 histidine phosphatase family protein [Bradyrhizobium sp. 143]MCK1724233.1 histidine phosphatase family protein [Bradyrhizobium sp. 142]
MFIVRHGAPHEDHPVEPADPPLTIEGRQQAATLATRLAAEGIDRIVSSPQRRAYETAQPLADRLRLPIDVLDGLAEVDRGTDRYRSPETIKRESPERWHEFLSSPIAYFGLSEERFRSNVLEAFAELLASGTSTIAVFSHGTPIKVILQHALGLKDRRTLVIGHCSMTSISGTSIDEMIVECVADQRMQSGARR